MAILPDTASAGAPRRPSPSGRCRVVIVDDHTAIIEMMRGIVESIAGFAVVGTARDPAEAREVCRREQPDVIVLDLVLPKVTGFSLYDALRGVCARARFLIFSGHLRAGSVREALLAGAHGLVEKSASLEEFHEALRAVASGQVYFSRGSSEAIRRIVNRDPARAVRPARLTDRERAVLKAIAEGLSSKQIAARLGISRHTVVNHRTRLMKKVGLRGVALLARYAAQVGLVDETVDLAE
jgi:DNA-binding NarL/FixJ family response regulator